MKLLTSTRFSGAILIWQPVPEADTFATGLLLLAAVCLVCVTGDSAKCSASSLAAACCAGVCAWSSAAAAKVCILAECPAVVSWEGRRLLEMWGQRGCPRNAWHMPLSVASPGASLPLWFRAPVLMSCVAHDSCNDCCEQLCAKRCWCAPVTDATAAWPHAVNLCLPSSMPPEQWQRCDTVACGIVTQ
eukprot:CAMPEP_0206140404 /NCGR_PEP_ID=MMETSP1473-20131121/9334_1 /ASSEMBLY_ACC=CAM_ASM_001109 /TAXON_ID=1461547 /ORGANISM="Stichococcus sp, Strain RCC1054" /LENGTH=187 /DNA_ID=CAMNT_0053534541 /DNA_START=709 /DNA_END=1269 /DNA_ORIENTATION=-